MQDFAFDLQGRIIAPVSSSDAYLITKVVTDGADIIVDKLVGGRMNGMGTGPGEFQGVAGIAVDPTTQNHVVCDSGNNRVQVFTQNGEFIRMFQTGPNPTIALFDYWGNLLVATNTGLEVYNEQGSAPVYGSIEGFVLDKKTGLPLEFADVAISSTFALPVQGTLTTEDGYFQLYTVPAGSHNIIVTKASYKDSSAVVSVVAGQRSEVNFYLDRIPVQTPGTGNVTGTLIREGLPVNGGGKGIPGLTIGVEGSGVSDITNDNGEFMLIGVDDGPQKLQIGYNGTIVYEKNIQVPDSQTLDIGIVKLFI
jgi:hypothetical protein